MVYLADPFLVIAFIFELVFSPRVSKFVNILHILKFDVLRMSNSASGAPPPVSLALSVRNTFSDTFTESLDPSFPIHCS